MIEHELHQNEWLDEIRTLPAPYVVDVGANWGCFTHLVCMINPHAQITAIEPQATCVRRIQDYARTSTAQVRVIRCAVSDFDGVGELAITRAGDTGARLVPRDRQMGDVAASDVEKVPVTTLDALTDKMPVDLLKIDVEGAEVEVLRGGEGTLSRTRNLLVECHTDRNVRLVREILGDGWREIRLGPVDHLFVNDVLKKRMTR